MEHLDNTEMHKDETPMEDARDTQSHNNVDQREDEEELRDMEDYLNFRKYGIVPDGWKKKRETLEAEAQSGKEHHSGDNDEAGNLEDREDHSMDDQEVEVPKDNVGDQEDERGRHLRNGFSILKTMHQLG